MGEIKLTVHPFRMDTDKEAALKPLEEASEIFGAWQVLGETKFGDVARVAKLGTLSLEKRIKMDNLADEIADCIQACVNLADRYGIDLGAALERVEAKNRERGRY